MHFKNNSSKSVLKRVIKQMHFDSMALATQMFNKKVLQVFHTLPIKAVDGYKVFKYDRPLVDQ